MELEINVTAKDIKEGKPGQCGECPISLATHRALEEAGLVFVDDDDGREVPMERVSVRVYFDKAVAREIGDPGGPGNIWRLNYITGAEWDMSPEARSFIAKFDDETCPRPKPFSFKVTLPE